MRGFAVLRFVLVVLACVASGTLECGVREMTPMQRRGSELYARMCVVCHGRNGEGYAADNAPSLSHPDFLASVTDDFLRNAIASGRGGTTMSAWGNARGGPLSRADVDSVVAFVRTWDRRPHATLDERMLRGDASRGQAVFAKECARCHGERGTGGPHVGIGGTELLGSATNGFLRYAVRRGRPGTAMPSFDDKIADPGTDDVIALLRNPPWRQPVAPPTQPPPQRARTEPLPLGPVPLNPQGPDPVGFNVQPKTTPVDVVKAQLDHGARMAILDARAPSDYVNEHIAGAVSVPFYDPDPYVPKLPRNAWLVAYCSCPHAESGTLAQKLTAKGFTKVTILDEGLGVWKSRKYPTSTGEAP